jgi:DNA topoisomerase VI subunit A
METPSITPSRRTNEEEYPCVGRETWIGPNSEREGILGEIESVQLILMVESRSVFQRLIEDQFHGKNSCILVTAGGYPSRRFRCALKGLRERLNVPFYLLADNDPAGYLSFFLLARGVARRLGHPKYSEAIPAARFIGLRANDFHQLNMSTCAIIDLSECEQEALLQLKLKPWLKDDLGWQHEFDQMQQNGFKVEMEALYSISVDFLAEKYLPNRLAEGKYLELSRTTE